MGSTKIHDTYAKSVDFFNSMEQNEQTAKTSWTIYVEISDTTDTLRSTVVQYSPQPHTSTATAFKMYYLYLLRIFANVLYLKTFTLKLKFL